MILPESMREELIFRNNISMIILYGDGVILYDGRLHFGNAKQQKSSGFRHILTM